MLFHIHWNESITRKVVIIIKAKYTIWSTISQQESSRINLQLLWIYVFNFLGEKREMTFLFYRQNLDSHLINQGCLRKYGSTVISTQTGHSTTYKMIYSKQQAIETSLVRVCVLVPPSYLNKEAIRCVTWRRIFLCLSQLQNECRVSLWMINGIFVLKKCWKHVTLAKFSSLLFYAAKHHN